MRDIAEFFTRKRARSSPEAARQRLLRHRARGHQGGSTFLSALEQLHEELRRRYRRRRGKPNFDTPENVADWACGPSSGNSHRLASPILAGGRADCDGQRHRRADDCLVRLRAWRRQARVSPFAGKFVYAPVPVKAGSTVRSAEAEPSVTVISAASKNAEPLSCFWNGWPTRSSRTS